MSHDELARAREIKAVQLLHSLRLYAAGERPNNCYKVEIEPVRLGVEPTEFALIQRLEAPAGVQCMQQVVPFETQRRFQLAKAVNKVIVRDRARDHEIEVRQLRVHPMLTHGGGGGEVPSPFFGLVCFGSQERLDDPSKNSLH